MRHPDRDPELGRLIPRYVAKDGRYLALGGRVLAMTGRERDRFERRLGKAAAEITPREVGILLGGGWRERRTAAWFIAVARRTEFRERLGELLLASEMGFAGQAYCVALADFGTPADADLLATYLDHYLPRPDLDYDQEPALGALLHLDTEHEADRAARFLTPDGPWQRWTAGRAPSLCDSPNSCQETISRFCAFANASARHCATRGADPAGAGA
ncbi:DUF6000 family protein [Streptomyces sp. NPDC050658]|uniref:DUF6000 family protein n=1 Tax=unclassified Streptomyces TaxID=2593676 RepID=UPI00342A1149